MSAYAQILIDEHFKARHLADSIMQLNSKLITSPPRAAATVVMLRDVPQGMEVFLLKRHGLSDVLGGAYVFPGGKLDRADAELDLAAHLDQSPQSLHASLNEPDIDTLTAASLYVAALREAFEESGVLFAENVSAAQAAQASAWRARAWPLTSCWPPGAAPANAQRAAVVALDHAQDGFGEQQAL